MRRLPLYEAPLPTPLEQGAALALQTGGCTRCPLGRMADENGEKSCIPAEAVDGREPAHGKLLVISDEPGRIEAEHGRPLVGLTGRDVRRVVEKHWPGDYVLDTAIRCVTTPTHQEAARAACAPFMRNVFAQAMPDRVIVLGRYAAKSVLGRDVPPDDTRKGYSWVQRPDGKYIPLMVLADPGHVRKNRFWMRNLEEDFAWALGPLDDLMPPLTDAVFHIVETHEDAKEAADALRGFDWLAYDCETAGKHYSDFFIVDSVSCTGADGETTYVWGPKALAIPGARAELKALLEDDAVGKTCANAKYDQLSARAGLDILVRGNVLDVQLTKHLDLPGSDASLETLSETVGMGGYKQDFALKLERARESIRRARKKNASGAQLHLLPENPIVLAAIAHREEDVDTYAYCLVPSPDLERYNARDTVCTARAANSRYGFALVQKNPAHRNVWRNLVCRATDAVEQIEAWGIEASPDGIENFNRYIDAQLTQVTARIARYNINPASPQQVAALMFDKLKLRNPHAPKSRSTGKEALRAMQEMHPFVKDLREHRRLHKLKAAYGSMDKFIREDGRIHPTFRIDGARSGRLSCVEPGLHQLPRKEDGEGHTEGALIKNCFSARPGYKLVALDESQVELRVAAALSQDPVMLEMFASGKDFHLLTAQRIAPIMWKMRPEDVGSAQRAHAKQFNFGLVYGMTDKLLALKLNCSLAEAARLRAAIMGEFKVLAQWMRRCLAYTQKHGTIVTPWFWEPGRVRPLWDIAINSTDQKLRKRQNTAANGAVNTPCQALGSDIVLLALIDIVEWLLADSTIDAKVVLTVHDSVIAEVREDHIDRYVARAIPIMTRYPLRGVPLVADAEVGDSLGSLAKLQTVSRAA